MHLGTLFIINWSIVFLWVISITSHFIIQLFIMNRIFSLTIFIVHINFFLMFQIIINIWCPGYFIWFLNIIEIFILIILTRISFLLLIMTTAHIRKFINSDQILILLLFFTLKFSFILLWNNQVLCGQWIFSLLL